MRALILTLGLTLAAASAAFAETAIAKWPPWLSIETPANPVVLPDNASAQLALTSIGGSIENGITGANATAAPSRSLSLRLGGGESRYIVRTFSGSIRLRRRPS